MKKLRITQIKSGIDRSERQKLTLQALGLNKLHNPREHEATPQKFKNKYGSMGV